jgi:hypothetical protein
MIKCSEFPSQDDDIQPTILKSYDEKKKIEDEQEILAEHLDPNESYRYRFSITTDGEPEIKYYKLQGEAE